MTDAQALGITARAALAKVQRELPRGTMQPGTVVQSQPPGPFGGARALVHIDGNPSGMLNEVDVIDGRQYPAGSRVMVEYVEPQGALIRAGIDCDNRTELLPFSSAVELVNGARSAPGRIDADAELEALLLDFGSATLGDVTIEVEHAGATVAAVVVPFGTLSVTEPGNDLLLLASDGPIYAVMADNGGGGWVSVTLTLVLNVACATGDPFDLSGGGGDN